MRGPDADPPAVMTARGRRSIDIGVIILTVTAAAAAAIDVGSPVRGLVVFAAFLLVPGWALVSLLDSGPPAAMLALAIGLSLAVDVAASLLLVWTGHFDDTLTAAAVLGALALLPVIRDLMQQPPPPQVGVSSPDATR